MVRLKILRFCFLFIFFIILVRLFYWQVLEYDNLTARAEQQHIVTVDIDAPRGLVLSSDGAILASNKPKYLLYAMPKVIEKKDEFAELIAETILSSTKNTQEKTNPQDFLKLKENIYSQLIKNLYWVPLSNDIDLLTKKNIESLNIKGIGFEDRMVRFYPEASEAAHLIGFVGADQLGNQKGYFGVEGYYDRELRGTTGSLLEEKDALGLPIMMGRFRKTEPENGHNLTLHLDRTVQYMVEKSLKKGMERYGAKSGSVIVMDPKTGAVLAMASFPNYDPNNFTEFSKETFRNPVTAESFEPGSIFKPLIMAAAINEKAVEPDTKCDICSGPVKIADNVIRTWNHKYYRDTTMTDAIIHSDNTGMVFAARKLGLDKLYQYLQDFGFGTLTQIDLQDEVSPDIRPKDEWREIDLATASFGQGVAATAIQVTRAVSAIANEGKLMEPHIISSVKMGDKIEKIEPKVVGKPISTETARIIAAMMVDAVEKGEAKAFVPKGYKIAGKTGTAQIPVAGHYDPTKTIASFIGFAPADNPRFIMLVRYTEPSSSIFGSETAAPTFFEIAKELLVYYNIAPSY
ncbi:MAG: penicillin-binding protein 2 [Armatimonadetes bacterium]|nr:MAG: penicillin-binding protein 2 [Armatimonadota bacterium]